ncbi:extracellular solute-binding protein [Paenibacillus paridis]|uniref:extracellular solute-binding protein n=1 Tax=Paenibacillus paridis TaxID=2583376 RepID=UPI00111EB878|nr:extracellular solute-binding protein [Paenibacillus paridis]
MRNKKKGTVALLSAALVAGLLAGCGSSNDKQKAEVEVEVAKEGLPIVNEQISLTLTAPDVGIQNWKDMEVLKEMEKLTNIKMVFNNAPKESFDTKKNLIFSSGEYPDVFYAAGLTPAEQMNYGEQGILIPLEDLIENYAPNVKKVLEDNPEIRKSITAPDGHIYSLPVIEFNQPWYRNPMWYNGDFLKALGYDKLPETTEELYTYLKRVKEEDPNKNGAADEVPLSSVNLRDIRTWLLGAYGIYEEEIYVDDSDVVHYTPIEDGYKEYLIFLNRLWTEDLLDHETFSQTAEQKKAKAQNNQVALFSDWNAYMTLGGEPSTDDPMFLPVKSEMVDKAVIAKSKGVTTGAFAISKTNSYPEASMRWVDYIYGYEGAMLFNKGPEGVLWEYTDRDSLTKKYLPVPGGGDREDYRATLTPNYGIPAPTISIPEIQLGLTTEFDEWVMNESKTKLLDNGSRIPYPTLFLTAEEQAEVTTLTSDLTTYVRQMEAKFITGADTFDNWDKYITTVTKMGGDRMSKIYQDAYDRWKQS